MRLHGSWIDWGPSLCRLQSSNFNLAREHEVKLPEKGSNVSPTSSSLPFFVVDVAESQADDNDPPEESVSVTWISDSDSCTSGDLDVQSLNADSQDSTTCSSRSSSTGTLLSDGRVHRLDEVFFLRRLRFTQRDRVGTPAQTLEHWVSAATVIEDQDLGDAQHFAPDVGFGTDNGYMFVEEGWSGLVIWPNHIPRADIDFGRQRTPNRVSL
mmetsp:Transcript_32672/g.57843  ORF Transcript_32672/g.57843 Transcript_32672/m.57843 type:complete len:211 (-) Transcript_32672:234-866(-)